MFFEFLVVCFRKILDVTLFGFLRKGTQNIIHETIKDYEIDYQPRKCIVR